MVPDDVADANALLAQYPALARIVDHITPETCGAVLTAIDKRADSPEKLARLRAVEFFGLRVYDTAYEQIYGSPNESWLPLSWAREAEYQSRQVWRRLYGARLFIESDEVYEGIDSYARMPANDDAAVLADFVDDAELMGLLGLEPGWTADLKEVDRELDT